MDMRIELYRDSEREHWDRFVQQSKNGTFLFLRDYMDYHRDRFQDHSLLVWVDETLIAVLPANRTRNTLESHGGLTYGGFVVQGDMRLATMLDLFQLVLKDLADRGLTTFIYKTVPHIYHSIPAEEDRYCLFRNGAIPFRSDVLSVIDCAQRLDYQGRRARSVNRARKMGLLVRESDDYAQFWEILSANLRGRHDVKPVHTVSEISLLAEKLRPRIRLYAAHEGQQMQAGAVLYLTTNVCHVQYNAATERGKTLGAQDLLFDYLVARHSESHRFFDLGVSTEKEGQYLNTGLVDYKEGLGGRSIVHDFFSLALNSG